MFINAANVEEKVFYDDVVWKDMPDLIHLMIVFECYPYIFLYQHVYSLLNF